MTHPVLGATTHMSFTLHCLIFALTAARGCKLHDDVIYIRKAHNGSRPTSPGDYIGGKGVGMKGGARSRNSGATGAAGAAAVSTNAVQQQVFFPSYTIVGAGGSESAPGSSNGGGEGAGATSGAGSSGNHAGARVGYNGAAAAAAAVAAAAAAAAASTVPFNDMDGLEAELRKASNQYVRVLVAFYIYDFNYYSYTFYSCPSFFSLAVLVCTCVCVCIFLSFLLILLQPIAFIEPTHDINQS